MPANIRHLFSVPALGAVLAILAAGPAPAHDIPADLVVRSYVKVDERQLELLVRVPLESMRDVVFPLRGPGYLDLARADEALRDAATVWIGNGVELYEDGQRLQDFRIVATRVALPWDRAFSDYRAARAAVGAPPLPDTTELMWNQALLDVLIEYPIASPSSQFAIRPNFERLGLRTTTVLRFIPYSGSERPYEFIGDPGLVRLDPRWHQAVARFIELGFRHILNGTDHLLFILCLIVPFRRIRPLVAIVTAFTVAHSITLVSSAFGFVPQALWFPPLIETLIAASIVYMAIENIVGDRWEQRWIVAFGFGLVHGFGFSFALKQTLQFAGSHLLTALFAFNLGVEFGQLFVVALAVPVINLLFRHVLAERIGIIVLSVLIAHSGWHWMSDRAAALTEYSFHWPALDLAFAVTLLHWLVFVLVIAAVLSLMSLVYRRVFARER